MAAFQTDARVDTFLDPRDEIVGCMSVVSTRGHTP
jgi:hypothetical protein